MNQKNMNSSNITNSKFQSSIEKEIKKPEEKHLKSLINKV